MKKLLDLSKPPIKFVGSLVINNIFINHKIFKKIKSNVKFF